MEETLMRRIVIVLILAGMLLELPGCKSAPPAPTAESETVVITFIAYEWTRKDYAALITEFEAQHPNIKVQFIAMADVLDGQEYDLRLMASAADTLWLGARPLLADDAYFRDLTPLIEADPGFDAADFGRACWLVFNAMGAP
jgi:ABC-type glycerol-3-phosphate transport system substrate-binding protein